MSDINKIVQAIAEADVSTKSWASVDKAKLPASCFLWVEDPEKKATWHLPVYEGAGSVDKDTGMYSDRGPLNANAVRAALAAVGGARTGKAMNVPASARKKLDALAKELKIGEAAEQALLGSIVAGAGQQDSRPWIPVDEKVKLDEQFFPLDRAIMDAVKEKYGQWAYVLDFSDKEIVFQVDQPMTAAIPQGVVKSPVPKLIKYKVTKQTVELVGDPVEVKRVVRYEEK